MLTCSSISAVVYSISDLPFPRVIDTLLRPVAAFFVESMRPQCFGAFECPGRNDKGVIAKETMASASHVFLTGEPPFQIELHDKLAIIAVLSAHLTPPPPLAARRGPIERVHKQNLR